MNSLSIEPHIGLCASEYDGNLVLPKFVWNIKSIEDSADDHKQEHADFC